MELEKFKSIMMPLREKLLSVARNLLANEEDAEDTVQETYLRLWSIRSQLIHHPNMQGYAMQTLKNACIDKLRSSRNNLDIDKVTIGEYNNPYVQTEANDNIRIVKNIIETLPELQRKIIMMRDVEGYELEEIADITGSETTAVRVNLSRARKKVRDKFLEINNTKVLK